MMRGLANKRGHSTFFEAKKVECPLLFANHLVVFAKAPRLGTVKTRLAADIGWVAATAFQRNTARNLLRRLGRDRRWRCWLAVTPDADAALFPWPAGWRCIGQGKGDLGRRMARPARFLPPGPVVIVGTDVPDIAPAHIAAAFKALGRRDVVFGPAEDGGYWLVGFRRRPRVPDIFGGVRWSSRHALADTLTNLDAGLDVAFLETLTDIDDGAAYAGWRKKRDTPGTGAAGALRENPSSSS